MNTTTLRAKVSSACEPVLLRQLREQRGWTQATLAAKSGYSLRLISKMESGKSISPQSLQDVADALSLPERPVSVDDLTSDPVGLARQYFAAMYEQRENMFVAIRHFLDDDVVFNIPGEPAQIPFSGVYHGLEGFQEFCRKFFACLEVPVGHDHLPHYTYAANVTDVMVWAKSWIHPKGHPFQLPMPISHLMRFRHGKLVLLEDSFDTQRASSLFVRVD